MLRRTLAGALFALLIIALPACQDAEPVSTPTPPAVGVTVGALAPDLALENLAGETVQLGDYRGQPVLINFWAVWCTFCRDELPEMQRVYQAYQDRGFVILAVDVQDDVADVRTFVDELELTFPVLLDRDAELTRSYRVRGLPTSYFVDQNGVIIGRQLGPIDEAWMERYLDQAGVK